MFFKQIFASILAAMFLSWSAILYMHFGPIHVDASDLDVVSCLIAGIASLFALATGTLQFLCRQRFFPGTESWGQALLYATPASLVSTTIGFVIAEWVHTNVGFGADHIPWTIFLSTGGVGMVAHLGWAYLKRS